MSQKDNNKPQDDNQKNQSEDTVKDQVKDILDEAIEEVEKDEKSSEDDQSSSEDKKVSSKTDKEEASSEGDQLRADLEKEKERFLRLFAEFENYKKRTSKERVELFKTAGQDIMVSLLPVLDDFDRALNEINKAKDKNLVKGVELIHNKLKETLRSKGLEVLEVKEGDTFDADIHEAVTQIPAPSDKMKGKIVDVLEKGYKMGERIVRYPKVVTGK